MAAKRKLKQIHLNIEDPDDWQLWDWANRNIKNFSDWGKRCLKAEMENANQHQERPSEHSEFSLQEITELVQDLIKTELAGHIVVTDQEKGGNEQTPDVSGYF